MNISDREPDLPDKVPENSGLGSKLQPRLETRMSACVRLESWWEIWENLDAGKTSMEFDR